MHPIFLPYRENITNFFSIFKAFVCLCYIYTKRLDNPLTRSNESW